MLRPALMLAGSLLAPSLLIGPAACSGSASDPKAEHGGAPASSAGAGASPAAGQNSGGGPSGGGAAGSAGSAGTEVSESAGAGNEAGSAGAAAGAGGCAAVVEAHPLSAGVHVATCSDIAYSTNPPSSGEHYPVWADFGVYDFPVPRGFWMHNVEHAAVVVTYHCPSGCDAEVARATVWLGQLSVDAACPGGRPRILLVPDPLLDTAWAASAWGFTLRANCFDEAAFSDFYLTHAGSPAAPEPGVCSAGLDLRAPGIDTCGAR